MKNQDIKGSEPFSNQGVISQPQIVDGEKSANCEAGISKFGDTFATQQNLDAQYCDIRNYTDENPVVVSMKDAVSTYIDKLINRANGDNFAINNLNSIKHNLSESY